MAEKLRRTRPGGGAAAQLEAEEPARTPAQEQEQAPPTADPLDPALLGDSHAWHSANAPARTAAILQLQRTHGNAYTRRAVQALLTRNAADAPAVQRDGPADTGSKAPAKGRARISVEAAKQGTLTFDAHSVTFAATARPGRGEHEGQSLEVLTEIGPETAKLIRAMVQGELIKSVSVDIVRTNEDGKVELVSAFSLHDALVVSVRTSSSATRDAHGDSALELAQIGFATRPQEKAEKPRGK